MLHTFEEINIEHDKTSPVLDVIKSKLYESGPGAGRERVDLQLSPRNVQRQPQPDIASVLLDSPRFNSSGLVSPLASTQRSTYVPRSYLESEFSPRTNLPPPSTSTSTFTESSPSMMPIGQPAPPGSIDPDVTLPPGFIQQSPRFESIPPPVSPLEKLSTHHIGLRSSPPDRPPPPPPPHRPLKSPKETTIDIIDIPIEPPEQRTVKPQTVKPRTVVCECVPKPKKSNQPSSSSSNLTKFQRMKNVFTKKNKANN